MKCFAISTLLAGMLTASVAFGARALPSGGHASVPAGHAVHSAATGKGHTLSPAFKPGTTISAGAVKKPLGASGHLNMSSNTGGTTATAGVRVSPLPLGEGQGVRGLGSRHPILGSPHPSPLPVGEGDETHIAPLPAGQGGAVAGAGILAGWRSTIEDGDGPAPSGGGESVWSSQGPEKAVWGGRVGNGPGYGCVRIYEPSSPENSTERSGETFCQTGEGAGAKVITGDEASLLFPNPDGDAAAHGVNYQELGGHDGEMGIHNADGSITWVPVSPDDNVVQHGDGSGDIECIPDMGTGLKDPGEICTIHDHEMAIYNADGSISYDPIPANDNTVSPSDSGGGGGQSGSGNQDDGQSSSDNNDDSSDNSQTVAANDTEEANSDDAAESPDSGGPEEGMPSPDGPDGGGAKDWQIRRQIRGPLGDPGWDSMPSPDGPGDGGPNWFWNWNSGGMPDPEGDGSGGPNWDDMPNPEGSEGGSPRS